MQLYDDEPLSLYDDLGLAETLADECAIVTVAPYSDHCAKHGQDASLCHLGGSYE